MSRIALRISLGILFVLVACTVLVVVSARRAGEAHFKHHVTRLVSQVHQSTHRVETAPPDRLPQEVARLRERFGYPVSLRAASDPRLPAEARSRARDGRSHAVHYPQQGWTLYIPVRQRSRVLVLGPVGRPRFASHVPVVIMLAGVLVIIVGTGFAVAAPIVRRVRRLERVAEQISEGELQARAEVKSKDAIGRLAQRFNVMAERVQDLLERQRQLIQDVSHELRTPISRLRFGLEMLEGAAPAEREARLAALEQDLDELEALVGELLLYIKVGDGALELETEDVPLRSVLDELMSQVGETRPEVGLSAAPPDPNDVAVRADPRFLRRALRNLLENAARHAEAQVRVSWSVAGATDATDATDASGTTGHRDAVGIAGSVVQLHVEDDGPGVPEEERQRILEPFTRVEASRHRGSGGAGLGLAIVRRIVEAHGGRVEVGAASAPLGGARFTLIWPSWEPSGTKNGSRGRGPS